MQYTNPTFRSSGPPPRGGGHPPLGPRGGSSTSTTYPRTQRFNNPPSGNNAAGNPSNHSQYLSDLPPVIKGGRKDESTAAATAKLERMEEEIERMRASLAEKERKLAPELRAWHKLERDSEKAAFKSQLAEDALRSLSQDDSGGVAF
jgi:hypothetical protein